MRNETKKKYETEQLLIFWVLFKTIQWELNKNGKNKNIEYDINKGKHVYKHILYTKVTIYICTHVCM